MTELILLIVLFVSWFMTGLLRQYALAHNLIDVPNTRSSHSIPVPRGGGVAIVIVFLFGVLAMWSMSLLDHMFFIGLLGAGLMVAFIGFIDDHGHIPARWRLLTHFSAVGWLLFWVGGLPPLIVSGVEYDLGWIGHLMAVFALVWLLNLYNFMDGIDGIAGVEAFSTTLVAGLLFFFVKGNEEMASLNILMSVSVAGFLVWNFPPAKIFMGDAGSGFLGLVLGSFVLFSAHVLPEMFWAWFILLGVFVVDATYTLIRRLLRGDSVYKAHRSHAYQYASRKYGSHVLITLSVLAINIFWLTPWAVAVAFNAVDGLIGILFAYSPLLWLTWFFHAGEVEQNT